MKPPTMAAALRLHETDASVTSLTGGPDFFIAAGLCGRLRAWQACAHATTSVTPAASARVAVRIQIRPSLARSWRLVLDVNSVCQLPQGRTTSHPFCSVSAVTSDGRFAFATPNPLAGLEIWDSRRWKRLQEIKPDEEEGTRDEWMKRGIKSVRVSCSCLALSGTHLACGSREGEVLVWKGDRKVKPFRRGLTADAGPLAAVLLTEELVIAAYQQRAGQVDGSTFSGEQSTAAWKLSTGAMLWKVTPAVHRPVIGASMCGKQLWLMHAHSSVTEPSWNLVFARRVLKKADGIQSCSMEGLLTSSPSTSTISRVDLEKDGRLGSSLSESCGAPSAGSGEGDQPLLCWDCCTDALALGFCAGIVKVILAAEATDFSASRTIATSAPDCADVAAVVVTRWPDSASMASSDPTSEDHLMAAKMQQEDHAGSASEGTALGRASHIQEDKEGNASSIPKGVNGDLEHTGAGGALIRLRIISASASGFVRIWNLEESSDEAICVPLALEEVAQCRLPFGSQPCRLCLVAEALICGCIDGSIFIISVRNFMSTRECIASMSVPPAMSGRTNYQWRFDTSSGPQACGLVEERRGAFDGWARTWAYEHGLQQVLARMNRGGQISTGTAGAAGLDKGLPSDSKPFPVGSLYRLDGLEGRPELNGSIVVVIGAVDQKSGRVPVRVLPPAGTPAMDSELVSTGLKIRPHNLVRVKGDEHLKLGLQRADSFQHGTEKV